MLHDKKLHTFSHHIEVANIMLIILRMAPNSPSAWIKIQLHLTIVDEPTFAEAQRHFGCTSPFFAVMPFTT
jgi:hypothetical protein